MRCGGETGWQSEAMIKPRANDTVTTVKVHTAIHTLAIKPDDAVDECVIVSWTSGLRALCVG